MKKILYTEQQIKKILGEDFVSYLNKDDNGCDVPSDSNTINDEVFATEPDFETPTLDKISHEKTRDFPFWRKQTYGAVCENRKKKRLTETNNKELAGKKFNLGKNTSNMIDAVADANPNDKMVNNMSNENGATANALYVRRNRLEKMRKDDPERFENISGEKIEKNITDTLNRVTAATKVTRNQTSDQSLTTVPNVNRGKGGKSHKSSQANIYYEGN